MQKRKTGTPRKGWKDAARKRLEKPKTFAQKMIERDNRIRQR